MIWSSGELDDDHQLAVYPSVEMDGKGVTINTINPRTNLPYPMLPVVIPAESIHAMSFEEFHDLMHEELHAIADALAKGKGYVEKPVLPINAKAMKQQMQESLRDLVSSFTHQGYRQQDVQKILVKAVRELAAK